jgi:hypothetical protein
MPNQKKGSEGSSGLTYFYDVIKIVEISYPSASMQSIAEEIAFARAVGPIVAQLKPCSNGVFEMMIPIGFGHKMRVELEFDRIGRLQPVMGEIIRG